MTNRIFSTGDTDSQSTYLSGSRFTYDATNRIKTFEGQYRKAEEPELAPSATYRFDQWHRLTERSMVDFFGTGASRVLRYKYEVNDTENAHIPFHAPATIETQASVDGSVVAPIHTDRLNYDDLGATCPGYAARRRRR